jgi:hypothetical protein
MTLRVTRWQNMFLSPELAQVPVTAALLVCLLVVFGALLLARSRSPAKPGQKRPGDCVFRNLRIPESLSSTIPVVGHVIKYSRNGHHYFSTLCFSTSLPIFTIRMANMKISLIKPDLTKSLPKVSSRYSSAVWTWMSRRVHC